MDSALFGLGGCIAFALPFLAIATLLAHYYIRRTLWQYKKRRGKANPGFCPSSVALGTIFLFAQVFLSALCTHAVEIRQDVDVRKEDEGEPETLAKQLRRQLVWIRRGEPVERLMLRL